MSNAETKTNKINIVKIVFAVVGIIVGLLISRISPPEPMVKESMWLLGIFAWAIIWWIGNVLYDWATGLIMILLFIILKMVPFGTAFGAFSTDTIWLMISAMIFGFALSKTGLLQRIVLNIMKALPSNFAGQTLAMILSGTIIAPMIPTTSGKAAMAAPFASGINEQMGYEYGSKESTGLFASMYFGFVCTGPLFLSGTFLNYTGLGLLDESISQKFNWLYWLGAMSVWGLVVIIGGYLYIKFAYGPKEDKPIPKEYIEGQLSNLGKISKNEIIVAITTLAVLALWMTANIHGLSAGVVAIIAFIVVGALKIIDASDIKKVPWDVIIFMGCIVSLSSLFPQFFVDEWMKNILGPYIAPLFSNMVVFVLVSTIGIYLLRFVMVSQTTMLMIYIMLLTPFAVQAGVSPWVLVVIVVACNNVWNTKYQNVQFIIAHGATQDKMTPYNKTIPSSVAYMALCTLGFLLSIPLWKLMGIM